ncbi:MAG: hypothetical protein IT384_10865 [Deltaproteobacteria bacterium]|nr:hypothetical protein [Deltaproteobacteria bacterium]
MTTRSVSLARRWGGRATTVRELCTLLIENGRWWLVPMVGVLLLSAVVLLAIQVAEYVAPFVYTIF